MPANDVYVVTGQEQYMIPAVKEFIKEINVSQGYIGGHSTRGDAHR